MARGNNGWLIAKAIIDFYAIRTKVGALAHGHDKYRVTVERASKLCYSYMAVTQTRKENAANLLVTRHQ